MIKIFTDIYTAFCQETVLIAGIFIYMLCALLFGKYFYKKSKWAAISVVIAVIISTLKVQVSPNYYAFNGAFISSFYVVFIKSMVLICTFFIILFSKNVVIKARSRIFDFFTLILLATLGALCVIGANDFITMFVSFELMGISSYILTTFSKTIKSKEAGLKYAVTGIVASCLMLIGIGYIYLAAGSLNFDVIYSVVRDGEFKSVFFNIGCVLCSLGLCFKLGLVPFSNWLPDTFEGTTNNIAAFISMVPVLAAFGIASRLIVFILQYTPMVQIMLFVIGVLSIYKGFLGAIRQDNLRRFMGYSSIAQFGFIILGFCLANPYAVSSSLFYMFSYIFMNVAGWAAVILFNNVTGKNNISDLKGLVYSSKSFSLVWIISLISFMGFPVTAGFWAKIYLYLSVVKCSELYLLLLIITMLGSLIGIYAYLRPIREMFEIEKNDFFKNPKFNTPKLALYVCSIITILICICPERIVRICQYIAYSL